MKLTAQSLRQSLDGVKSFVHRGFHATKGFLGDLDHGVNIARKTYSALSPFLDQLGASHRPVVKALEGYDALKARAMRAHDQGDQAYQAVRKSVPELNFT